MCRIAGGIDRFSHRLEKDVLLMRDAMEKGGPDSEGIFSDPDQNIAMGHRRLSIIDLTACGHQPMTDATTGNIIVFNGEIYNYLELKADLIRVGHTFISHSDTEVILKAYKEWGCACFSKFKGMFALGIYDVMRKELILARDHAGIKPLYYYADEDRLYFASEIRAFNCLGKKWKENPLWRVYFLTYGFLPDHVTTLEGVRPLEKGSFIVFHIKTLQSKQTFFFRDHFTEEISNGQEAVSLIRSTMENALKRHLIADAPIGLFLSGGIDSSILTLLAKKYKSDLHTLSIVFEDKQYSEQYYQELIAKKTGSHHQSFLLTKNLFVEAIPDILQAMDQPSADGINSYFISKYAKEAGLKAVLSGLGADELFGGYPSFKRTGMINQLRKIPAFVFDQVQKLPVHQYKKLGFLGTNNYRSNYLFNRGYFTPLETAKLLDMDCQEVKNILFNSNADQCMDSWSDGNRNAYLESNLYMEHQLLRDTDFMSMWHSIEVRVPFLDIDLVRATQRIGTNLKFGNIQPKYLLIESCKDILPEEIWKRKKKGFQLPFNNWMKDSLDQFITSKEDKRIQKHFDKGTLSWSRYWTYILSQQFAS